MKALAIIVFVLLYPALGLADEAANIIDTLDLSTYQTAADEAESGVDVRNTIIGLATGDIAITWDSLTEFLRKRVDGLFTWLSGIFSAFMLPMILSALCRHAAGSASKGALMICELTCAALFLGVATDSLQTARELLSNIANLAETVLPILTGLSTLAGAATSSALLTPMAGIPGTLIVEVLGDWGVKLCGAACACACAAAFSGAIKLDGIFSIIKSTVMWGAGVLLALFVGVLTVQGMLGAAYDSAAVKTVQFAFDKMIPIIGGNIADSMEAALSSILLVKSAAGVTGMLVFVSACATPIIKIWATFYAIRMASAVTQPVSDGLLTVTISRFADVMRMLLSLCLVAVMLAIILVGATISAGLRIA